MKVNLVSNNRVAKMSIIPSPPKKIVVVNKKPRESRVYTIHNYYNNPFMIRQNSKLDPYIGSTIISFKREVDAIQFAYMIESHKRDTKEWPSTTMEGMTSLFVKDTFIMDSSYLPTELYLKTWDLPALRLYCASNILNLFIMHSMTLKEGNIYNLKGEHITLSISLEDYAKILEKMFQRESKKDIDDEWN
jgi:hypothetical protein